MGVLALIWLFGLGVCGVDRCYMGGCCLGICKAFTLGGCGIWFVIDWFALLKNFLQMKAFIDIVGFWGCFEQSHLDIAFYVGIIGILSICCLFCGCCCLGGGWGVCQKKEKMPGAPRKHASDSDSSSESS